MITYRRHISLATTQKKHKKNGILLISVETDNFEFHRYYGKKNLQADYLSSLKDHTNSRAINLVNRSRMKTWSCKYNSIKHEEQIKNYIKNLGIFLVLCMSSLCSVHASGLLCIVPGKNPPKPTYITFKNSLAKSYGLIAPKFLIQESFRSCKQSTQASPQITSTTKIGQPYLETCDKEICSQLMMCGNYPSIQIACTRCEK